MKKSVLLKDLKRNLFVRTQLNADHALHLAALMESGVELPPILVNQDLVVIDGRHRIEAHDLMKRTSIQVEIRNVTDETELIALAYRANIGGSLLPTKEDTEHTVSLLIERGETIKNIAQILALPPSLTRSYVSTVKSKISRVKLQRAASAVTDGGLTLSQAAEKNGVEQKRLREFININVPPTENGIPQMKRQITSNFRSISGRNAKCCERLWNKLDDGDVTVLQVRRVLKHIETLQERSAKATAEWHRRFEQKFLSLEKS